MKSQGQGTSQRAQAREVAAGQAAAAGPEVPASRMQMAASVAALVAVALASVSGRWRTWKAAAAARGRRPAGHPWPGWSSGRPPW